MTTTLKRHLPLILMTGILLLATAVRAYNLGGQSFWYDEGVAFGHSQRTLFEMIPRLQNNVHVPGYFGTLALFEDFAGHSEFALRYYSVLWSLLSVAATYALGKRLFHPIPGLAAALLVTLNSFSIYYAQETRMYAMLAAVAALSMWAFVRWAQLALKSHSGTANETASMATRLWAWGLAFAALNTLGEYTHVSYALVMLGQGILALFVFGNLLNRVVREQLSLRIVWRALLVYVAVNLLSLVLFAPWIITAISQISAQPNISDPLALSTMAQLLQGWFGFGITYQEGIGGMQITMYFLLLFGLLGLTDKRRTAWWMLLVPLVWVLVSVGLYLYLELFARYLRFLLPAQIAFALWMGRGVWVLWSIVPRAIERRTGWQRELTIQLPKIAATFAILAFSYQLLTLLPSLYHDDTYTRDDYRGLVATIESEAGVNDAIVLSAPGLQEIFGYYYAGELPVYTLPAGEDIAADTRAVIADHERIYAVLYGQYEQDPDGVVEATLNTEAFPISSEWVGDVRFQRYAAPASFPAPETVDAQFGDAITLKSLAIASQQVRPNDALQLQFVWQASEPIDTRYKVFVQLLDSAGQLVAQRDSEPANNLAPTTTWPGGEDVIDNHALAIPQIDAGDYTLIVGLYDLDNPSARLPVGTADFLIIAEITVE